MLIEFKCANFRSINEIQTFSLVAANKDKRHPNNLIPHEGYDLLKVAALYGANASGKSNLIKALEVMRNTIINSATKMNFGDNISGIVPFRLLHSTLNQPAFFEIIFMIENAQYRYGFTATRERICDEWLFVTKPDGIKEQRWFERRYNFEAKRTVWTFSNAYKKIGRLLQERTRDNALALSTGSRENIIELQASFEWFRNYVLVLDLSKPPEKLKDKTATRFLHDESFRERALNLLKDADLGIADIAVTSYLTENISNGDNSSDISMETKSELANLLSQAIRSIVESAGGTIRDSTVLSLHKRTDADEYEEFDFDADESNGTQRFFAVIGPFLDAINTGGLIVVDELECSMHPLLTRKLIELFQSPHIETKGAQLIFATHDSSLLDPELFRRDQLWIAEKTKGASEFYSLYDFDTSERPRNTEAFQRNYLAGRYGGVAQFGPTFEDLILK